MAQIVLLTLILQGTCPDLKLQSPVIDFSNASSDAKLSAIHCILSQDAVDIAKTYWIDQVVK